MLKKVLELNELFNVPCLRQSFGLQSSYLVIEINNPTFKFFVNDQICEYLKIILHQNWSNMLDINEAINLQEIQYLEQYFFLYW